MYILRAAVLSASPVFALGHTFGFGFLWGNTWGEPGIPGTWASLGITLASMLGIGISAMASEASQYEGDKGWLVSVGQSFFSLAFFMTFIQMAMVAPFMMLAAVVLIGELEYWLCLSLWLGPILVAMSAFYDPI